MRNLDYFADLLLDRVKKNFDSVIIVDSGSIKGTGKSSWAIELSKAICKKIGYNYTFDLIIFNPTSEKIIDKVKTLPEGCPIHIDEPSKVAYKRDFQKEFSKDLMKFITICRKFRKITIFTNPEFWDLDKDLRNLADFRVTILRRGIAQVRGKYVNPEVGDKWLRDESRDIIDANIKSDPTDVNRVIGAIRKTPNYLFDLPFNEMGQVEYMAYEKLSKVEELKGMEKPKLNKWAIRAGAAYTILLQNGFTSVTLAKIMNKALSNYIHFCNMTNAESLFIDEPTLREIRRAFEGKVNTEEEYSFYNNNKLIKDNSVVQPNSPNISNIDEKKVGEDAD